jgi:hypothetical protein
MSARLVVLGAGLALPTLPASGSSYLVHVLSAVAVFGPGLAISAADGCSALASQAPRCAVTLVGWHFRLAMESGKV